MVSAWRSRVDFQQTRPIAPVAAIALLTFAATGISPAGTDWKLVLIAAAITACLAVLSLLTPWERLPAWTYVLPPIAVLIPIALLRQAQGGSSSGYGILAILPVAWVALLLTRRLVVVAACATAAMFVLPIAVIGDPLYPAVGLRGALLTFAVALTVGLVVNAVISQQRRHAVEARQRERDLAETQLALSAVAHVAREIAAGVEPRALICSSALAATSASMTTIVEPTQDGAFEITGSAGLPIETPVLQRSVKPGASLRAFFAGSREFVPDVTNHPGVSQLVIQTAGLVSILYEPIIRHGKPVGVLSIGWSQPRQSLDERTLTLAAFLAAEAGAAIERANLVARLDTLAQTDELTRLPNRRAWDARLHEALHGTADKPICVALLDLDYFKSFNDSMGHLAGDELLREAAIRWREQLRPGDLLARIGGEEFAILLPACTKHDAIGVLERLRLATPTATCSIGLAQHRHGETAAELISRADNALYTAKNQGRDRLIAA